MDKHVPVLLLIFNRPKQTREIINALREVKPLQLFIGADGPRQDHAGEYINCHLARQAATDIDWSCDIQTRFLNENIGCGLAVSSAITWFFQYVEHGIILEDDCVPHPHLFRFCRELFDRYMHDERIMGINGFAPYPIRRHPYDYHFSRRFRCWGWGTWRRAWRHFRYELGTIDETVFLNMLKAYYPFHYNRKLWLRRFRQAKKGELTTWAFRWEVACFSQSGLFIAPERSLVTNIGFGVDATHTERHHPVFSNVKTHAINFPLRHPLFVYADCNPDRYLEITAYQHLTLKSRLAWRLRHVLGAIADFAEHKSAI